MPRGKCISRLPVYFPAYADEKFYCLMTEALVPPPNVILSSFETTTVRSVTKHVTKDTEHGFEP